VLDGSTSTKADWTKFERECKRLFKKLGPGCRFCGNDQPEFYMLNDIDLWRKVVNVEPNRRCYGAGRVCLACVTERLYPRQLYHSDMNNGTNGPLGTQILEWYHPETGQEYDVEYSLQFPVEGDEPFVRVEMHYGNLPLPDADGNPDDQWTDAIWQSLFDLEDDYLGWLVDYCRAHGLKLIWDDQEVDLAKGAAEATD
jgi:hypothetical protein